MSINKADEKELGTLHGTLAKILRESLEQTYLSESGERLPPPTAILSVARQFLKDNKIEGISVKGSALNDLADLPIFEDDNVVSFRR